VRLAQRGQWETAGPQRPQKAAWRTPGKSVAGALRGLLRFQCPALPRAEGMNQPGEFGQRPAFQPGAAL